MTKTEENPTHLKTAEPSRLRQAPRYPEAKEQSMPHVIVKLWPGKSEQQKARLSEEIVKDVMDILNYGEESVSVAIKEVKSEDWLEKVYEPDIRANWAELYKKLIWSKAHSLMTRSREESSWSGLSATKSH